MHICIHYELYTFDGSTWGAWPSTSEQCVFWNPEYLYVNVFVVSQIILMYVFWHDIYIYMPYDANLYYSLMHEPISWYMTLRNGCEHIIKPSTLVFLVYFRCRFTMVSQAAEPAWQHLFFLVAQANSSWTHDGILLAYGVWVEWDLSFFPPVHLMASGKSWQRERRLLAYGLRIRIYRKFSQN